MSAFERTIGSTTFKVLPWREDWCRRNGVEFETADEVPYEVLS